jgi:hypothetical protein
LFLGFFWRLLEQPPQSQFDLIVDQLPYQTGAQHHQGGSAKIPDDIWRVDAVLLADLSKALDREMRHFVTAPHALIGRRAQENSSSSRRSAQVKKRDD